ncbi:MAG TPA: accessory factor UbiK family protein [Devosia sp.]|jgi:BMFP domain-containing protein YqiC
MTTQNSRFFDEIGRMMNGAAGAADGIRREVETLVRSQAERFVADMDLVKREDFDALREQVQLQDSEIKALRAEIDSLKAPKAP